MDRILLVDDDPAMRNLVKERLKNSYEVVDTSDPSEALSLALKTSPKCILLDLLMPGLTGFELCKTLSTLTLTQGTPIVVMSGNPIAEYEEFCSHLGAKDYFQKPLDFHRLRGRIAELIDDRSPAPRPDIRVNMRVAIELRGLDQFGAAFHEVTETENVSVGGFRCPCSVPLKPKLQVEVYLRSEDAMRRIGRAEVIHRLRHGSDKPRYGFHFTRKPSEWVL